MSGAPAQWERLRQEAERALRAGPWSVADKVAVPPSGDKHDYLSVAPYWWPDPAQPDGLPYIRRDGEINPEFHGGDRQALEELVAAVETLALAHGYLDDNRYGRRAVELLRVWFIDKPTRMNPHLEFAQGIRGVCTGRGIGIIDTVKLCGLPAAIARLPDAPTEGLRDWFGRYLDWLLASDHGRAEARAHNNHGTWHDAQVATFAVFVGRLDVARECVRAALARRVATQIEPDGRQPHELARTLSFHYSVFNLTGLMTLALAGEQVGVDLWHAQTGDGRGIRRALDWLLPYATGERAWTFPQIKPIAYDPVVFPLRLGALRYDDDRYERALASLPGVDGPFHRINLLYPPTH